MLSKSEESEGFYRQFFLRVSPFLQVTILYFWRTNFYSYNIYSPPVPTSSSQLLIPSKENLKLQPFLFDKKIREFCCLEAIL